MIIELPNFVSGDTCKLLRERIAFQKDSDQATMNMYSRDGLTVDISKDKKLKDVDAKLLSIFNEVQKRVVQQRYKPSCASADSGYEYHKYGPGMICHHHIDGEFSQAEKDGSLLRYASVILHLNTVDEGGELIFPSYNKKIKTEEGKIVIFPPTGSYGHYTSPSKKEREVIVTWFVYSGIVIKETRS